jgi:hypothetical protein
LKKQKVLYVLGAGYSGSTLLGLSLGTLKDVVNLGEVASLENDYRPPALCTCSKSLQKCEFWSGLKKQLEKNQKNLPTQQQWNLLNEATRQEIDKKGGGLRKFLAVLGVPLRWLMGSTAELDYLKKNESFFNQAFHFTQAAILVDLSKTPERLNILRQSAAFELYCVYLKRNPREVFASNLKRPKKSRAHFGFKVWREAFWYGLRNISYNRLFKQLPEEQKTVMHWEDFTREPVQSLNQLAKFMGLKEGVKADNLMIDPRLQHVYSGNLWLHRERHTAIKIETQKSNRSLKVREFKILKSILTILGLGKELSKY